MKRRAIAKVAEREFVDLVEWVQSQLRGNKMQKTKIEWVRNPDGTQGYTDNPVKGKCPMACSYCYARKMYVRFHWNPEIRYEPKGLVKIENTVKPCGIFLGSTFELFWDYLERFWQDGIFKTIRACPQHRFYLLTKQPQNLIKWSPFPENCWVGVTATDGKMFERATYYLRSIEAKIKYISFEPLLDPIGNMLVWLGQTVDWVIIGQQTPVKKATMPQIEWVREIMEACDKASVPVFIKNNLAPYARNIALYPNMRVGDKGWDEIRQEMP